MTEKIVTNIEYLPVSMAQDFNRIEKTLTDKYKDIIRWAVISIENEKLAVSVSYKCSSKAN